MADLSDRETFEHWLAGIEPAERRREIKHALAARSTLRVVPLLGRMKGDAVTDYRGAGFADFAGRSFGLGRRQIFGP
jgi:hypothetical protein